MKDFDDVDVFIPDEAHKAVLNVVYDIFSRMVAEISIQLEEQTYKNGLLMMDYAPIDTFKVLMAPYGLKFYYDEKSKTLYLVLVYIYKDNTGEEHSDPIVHINVSVDKQSALNEGSAGYLLTIALILHVGQKAVNLFEGTDSQ